MADELELKAVIPDAEAFRGRMRAAGAAPSFEGRMHDRRFDRGGELAARDEVLRVRTYDHPDGRTESLLAWKGPVRRSPEGYKARAELELMIGDGSAPPERLLDALGYSVIHAIDREVEIFTLAGATLRLERYPRMDLLLEVEGEPAAIEHAIGASGIERTAFSADSLADFVRRFEERTGRPAQLAAP